MIINVERMTLFTGVLSDGIVTIGSLQIAHQLQLMGITPDYEEINDCSLLILYNFGDTVAQYVVLVTDGKVETWRLHAKHTWRKEV